MGVIINREVRKSEIVWTFKNKNKTKTEEIKVLTSACPFFFQTLYRCMMMDHDSLALADIDDRKLISHNLKKTYSNRLGSSITISS
jgi:hypothetical protein